MNAFDILSLLKLPIATRLTDEEGEAALKTPHHGLAIKPGAIVATALPVVTTVEGLLA